MAMKEEISGMDVQCHAKQVRTMQATPGASDLAAYNLQVDIRENLKRIYYHAKRVAKLEAHVDDAAAWTSSNREPAAAETLLHPALVSESKR